MARILQSLLFAAVLLIGAAGATNAAPFALTGVWALQSMATVDMASGQTTKDFGEHPKGYVIYTPDFMSVVINAEGRQPVAPDAPNAMQQRAQLFGSMTAHAGPYEFADGKLVNHVKAAHDPKMVGQDIVRFIKVIDNNHLESIVPPSERNGHRVKVVLTWERVS